MSNKSDIRSAIFSSSSFKKKTIEYNGVEIEVRQPSIAVRNEITDRCFESLGEARKFNTHTYQVSMIIELCYVPGTNEKIFEKTDFEAISNCATNSYADDLLNAIQDFAEVNIQDAKKS